MFLGFRLFCFFFFFSSRRRHTRFDCDWSSDVCSSDLVKLPDADIVVVHSSDGSGTTFIWTDYLSKISPEWEQKVGKGTSANWPVGLGGKGNEGVTATVKQTPGAIGYVELGYAMINKLPAGAVQN